MTAQDLLKDVMRDKVGPGLRAMGFRGSYTRNFYTERDAYRSWLWTQKTVHSTKARVEFWIHLAAAHEPTKSIYWQKQLIGLVPGMAASSWTVVAGSPPGPVADSVLDAIRRYGLPAMQAAIDSPGFPPDPRVTWARTFPPAGDHDHDGPPGLDEITSVLHPTGEPADEWLAMLASHSPVTRMDALRLMAGNARDDPRYRVVLRDRREHDPSRRVRRYATDLLGPNFQHDGGDSPPDLDEIAWALAPTGKPADQWFTWLASGDAQGRSEAIRMIGRKARRDSRSLPVLLDRLEHDPSPHVRENAAEALGHLVTNEPARKALRETAAKDEDMQVRWAARYALKLTAPAGGAPT